MPENIIKQEDGERFALDHNGVALYGDREQPALQHQHSGLVVHETVKPLVHMICWEEEATCDVNLEVSGRITVAGDKEAPVEINMRHHFANDHQQTLNVEPFDHTMKVSTALAEPIHHALQLRTPLQLRFCNTWEVESNYAIEVTMGDLRLFSIRLTGSTVADPQPCDDDCPPGVDRNPTVRP